MNLVPLPLPWLEVAITVSLMGAAVLSLMRDPLRAARWGLVFSGLAAFATAMSAVSFFLGHYLGAGAEWSVGGYLAGRPLVVIDELNAPLLPVVGLLQFLTALATARTKMPRYSYAWSMLGEAVRLAAFSCVEPWPLVTLLAAEAALPIAHLVRRNRSTRVYVLHMGLFITLMVLGQSLVSMGGPGGARDWATLPLLAAVLVRCGTVPAHCWVTDLFENNTFGSSLLFVAPITGAYLAVRLVLPIAPSWVLQSLGLISLVTAVYAAGMAVVQREARRFFAYLFLSHSSLVLVGLELATTHGLTGGLCLWFSVAVSLGGFGLTLRALEARYGRLALTGYRGIYSQSPALAVGFLLTGLASVGFPGTLGFISADLLVDGAIEASPWVGLAVAVAAALNGIAVLRVYFLLFTGARHASTVALNLGLRERLAVLTLAALIFGGGLFPQPGVASRHAAASAILKDRASRVGRAHPDQPTSHDLAQGTAAAND